MTVCLKAKIPSINLSHIATTDNTVWFVRLTYLSTLVLSVMTQCLSLLFQAINKKKEDDVDKGTFYPTPPESIGEQSQGMKDVPVLKFCF